MSNNFDKEIAAEDEATFKSLFKPMKFFFENNDFVSKYGKYPQFWQDLKEWEHFVCIKKIYMIYTDQIDGGIENPDIKKIQDKLDEKKKKETDKKKNEPECRRKKKGMNYNNHLILNELIVLFNL